MVGKREKLEDIVLKLRQVEVLQGRCRSAGQHVRGPLDGEVEKPESH